TCDVLPVAGRISQGYNHPWPPRPPWTAEMCAPAPHRLPTDCMIPSLVPRCQPLKPDAMNSQRFRFAWQLAAALALLLPAAAAGDGPTAVQIEFFEQKIRPVLVAHCYKCHATDAKKIRGGLLLDSRAGLRKGAYTRPAIVPGDAAASLLVKALRYEAPRMPPPGKLHDRVIADFTTWIKDGAVDPRENGVRSGERTSTVAARSGVRTPAPSGRIDIEAGRRFW